MKQKDLFFVGKRFAPYILLLLAIGHIFFTNPDVRYAKKVKAEQAKFIKIEQKNNAIINSAHESFATDSIQIHTEMNEITGEIYNFIKNTFCSHPMRANENFFISEFEKMPETQKQEFRKLLIYLAGDTNTTYISDKYEKLFHEVIVTHGMYKYDTCLFNILNNSSTTLKIQTINSKKTFTISRDMVLALGKTISEYNELYKGNFYVIDEQSWYWWNTWADKNVMVCLPYNDIYFAVDTTNPVIKSNFRETFNKYNKAEQNLANISSKYSKATEQCERATKIAREIKDRNIAQYLQ